MANANVVIPTVAADRRVFDGMDQFLQLGELAIAQNRVFSAAYYSDHAQDQAMDQERPSGVNAVEDFVLTMNAASALRFPGFAAQNLQRDA